MLLPFHTSSKVQVTLSTLVLAWAARSLPRRSYAFVLPAISTRTTAGTSFGGGSQLMSTPQPPHHQFSPRGRSTSLFLSAPVKEDASNTAQKEGMTTEDLEILFDEKRQADGPMERSDHRTMDRFGNILQDPTASKDRLLDHAKDPLINKLSTMRSLVDSCPDIWLQLAKHCPEKRALLDEHLCDDKKIDVTFAQMCELVQKSAAVFNNFGITKGMHVAILAENSARWLMADHGIQLAGGASAVRGADAPLDELRYIYEHSDSARVVVLQGPRLVQKLTQDAKAKGLSVPLGLTNEKYGPVETIILLNREKKSDVDLKQLARQAGGNVQLFMLDDLMEQATPLDASRRPRLTRDDISTIVYTSGTTGNPKGVVLTHGNLLHQTGHRLAPSRPVEETEPLPGEVMVSILPVWHITERVFELWLATRGCSVVYSSIRTFKNDLAKHKPQWIVLVPRVLEKIATGVQDKFASGSLPVRVLSKFFTAVSKVTYRNKKIAQGLIDAPQPPGPLERIAAMTMVAVLSPLQAAGNKLIWSKVQQGFGGRLKVIICGGSALSGGLETFYESAGLPVCVGYGLTECSPLLTFRRSDCNFVTAGCVGRACLDTEVRVVDPDSKVRPRPSLPHGETGVVLGKGPQVTPGYYKNPKATSEAIDEYGWFNTGDLGRINPATGDLILTGRAKDTIVLSNGENIEPTPIEDAIMSSPLVDQIMVTGQDGRRLVAVVVLNPTEVGLSGFLDNYGGEAMIKKLNDAKEKVNDPKCSEEEYEEAAPLLNDLSAKLRANEELQKRLLADMKAAGKGKGFRPWENVGDVYMTLEPFAMVNGLLTQSFKVKRASVLERYQNVIKKNLTKSSS